MLLPTIKNECSQFLSESNNLPLLKNLPVNNDGFRKVKVRIKRKRNIVIESFNRSFSEHKELFQRAIFANGEASFTPSNDSNLEPFYIFPINGYKFIYNPIVENAHANYHTAVNDLLKVVPSYDVAVDMFSKIIKSSYTNENMPEGIKSGAELVLFNIPYYYAIRKTIVDDYNRLV